MRRSVIGLILASVLAGATSMAAAACWMPVPAADSIVFNTTQAGAPFQGSFTKFAGAICLDQPRAQDNYIRVKVQTASVDTGLPELDDALRGPDFFDVSRWPQASFVSESVSAQGAGRYQVTGKLTLRDVTREISVAFTLAASTGGGARLQAALDFERLDYHIGLGQWRDTRWVGNEVNMKFSIGLKPVAADHQSGQTILGRF